jgi:hypothetical protein
VTRRATPPEPSGLLGARVRLRAIVQCVNCQALEDDRTLHKCPICFKLVCNDCGQRSYGRIFCSRRCADQFFFGDDDE